jgi:hypothetical protein
MNRPTDRVQFAATRHYISEDLHVVLASYRCVKCVLPFTEAHPERFNSRLRNKMFYGQAGGKDLLRRKWKGLAEFVTLECDGKDMTPKLKDLKVHAIVFLNIPRYDLRYFSETCH